MLMVESNDSHMFSLRKTTTYHKMIVNSNNIASSACKVSAMGGKQNSKEYYLYPSSL